MKQLLPRKRWHFQKNDNGSIAVEFALIAPVLMLILAGVVDIGSATYAKISLDAQITAAAEFALLQPASGDRDTATAFAGNLIGLLQGGALETAEVIVNNAVGAEWNGTAVSAVSRAGDLGDCYCPTLTDGDIAWQAPAACGTPCASGDSAGRFLQISATAPHVSIFPGFGFIEGDVVKAQAVLRVQ